MFKIISSKHTFSEGDYFLSDFGKEVMYQIAHKTISETLDLCTYLSCDKCPLYMAIMETKGLKSDDEWDYSKNCTEQITANELYNWMYENWWRFLIKEDKKETVEPSTEEVEPSTKTSTKGYRIWLEAFANYSKAKDYCATIQSLGQGVIDYSKAFIQKEASGLYYVQVGFFQSRDDCQKVVDELESLGYYSCIREDRKGTEV